MNDCIFCKVVAGEIPSTKVYEDDVVYAFRDISPQAPAHVLIIPKGHVAASMAEITPKNSAIIAHIFEAAAVIARELGLERGFRVVSNCGPDARQSVHHIHFHLLGGEQLSPFMG